jgi:hypothetical protein
MIFILLKLKSRKINVNHKKFSKNLAYKRNSFPLCHDFLYRSNMAVNKKRVIKSLENLSEDLKELLHDQYPNGYEASITRITNAKKEPIFVFPLETEDATYLVKVPVTKNSDGEYDVESGERDEFSNDDNDSSDGFDNNSDDFENENSSGGSDYDDEGGGKRGREASYDPDFDT